MPSQHKHKVIGIRGCPEDLAKEIKAKAPDGNVSALTVAFWRWYVGRDGAELPARPVPSVFRTTATEDD